MDAHFSALDDALVRIRIAQRRPGYRQRLLGEGLRPVAGVSELGVLRAVIRGAESGGAVSINDVARDLGVEHSTASRAVAGVVAKGLIVRSSSDRDRRRASLNLTPAGIQAVAEGNQRRLDLLREAANDLRHSDISTLATLLSKLADGFDRYDDA